jgi:5-methylcytosine-specific restriction endonuclease McrA
MTTKGPDKRSVVISATKTPRVTRSSVPEGKPYFEYKEYLRLDFLCSCAYCTMSEAEAQAIRFTIDHYEPRKSRPDLENSYDNLTYACDECNRLKGDRSPPPDAREDGVRFFRPDHDSRSDHFETFDMRVESKTNTGRYSILALGLNRNSLRRIRQIRTRLDKCDQFIADGVLGLRNFSIDRLPRHVRAKALTAIRTVIMADEKLGDAVDDILIRYAGSPLLGTGSDLVADGWDRAKELKSIEGLYAGNWRAPSPHYS